MNNFLSIDDVVSGSSAMYEATPVGTNEVREERSRSINNDLGNDLIGYITESNRSELFNCIRLI